MGKPKSNVSTSKSCDRIESEPVNYTALAAAAWKIAEEQNQKLDAIERMLDEGRDEEALVAMRRYFKPTAKPVTGETHGKAAGKAVA